MGKTREIKKRIKAVANIRRITKTMQMIATSKFSKAQHAAMAGKPYTQALFDLVSSLASAAGDASHPLLAGPKDSGRPGRELTLVVTSERGLCGPYNGNVLRTAMQFFRTNASARDGLIEVVGKKGAGFFRYAGIRTSAVHHFGDKVSFERVRDMAEQLVKRYLAGEISLVRIISMKYISAGKQTPQVLQLIPFEPPKVAGRQQKGFTPVFEFSPDAATLLGDVLPAAVRTVLFQAFNDAVVSEHVARMVAMKAATDNAGKAGKRYTRQYNRARQAQITTELTEIVTGAAALS